MLTVRQVANKLGVHPKTVRRWITEGKLPCQRIGAGKLIRIDEAEVDKISNVVKA
jgi:excisionase family DNA binding protein